MSRVAKSPVEIPNGVTVTIESQLLTVKGDKGELTQAIAPGVIVTQENNQLTFSVENDKAWTMAGTIRALVNNMVIGVSKGFERKLQLVGVGYRAKATNNVLNLALGFSYPVNYTFPEGITVDTPTQTEVVVKGADKQRVGQIASEIRAFRPPEPYKGKGVRYADENVLRKEAKKK